MAVILPLIPAGPIERGFIPFNLLISSSWAWVREKVIKRRIINFFMGELFCCFKVFAAFFGILHINNTKNFLNKMHKGLIKYTQLLFVLLWLGGMPLSAQDYLPEKPKKETSVYDMANMMMG